MEDSGNQEDSRVNKGSSEHEEEPQSEDLSQESSELTDDPTDDPTDPITSHPLVNIDPNIFKLDGSHDEMSAYELFMILNEEDPDKAKERFAKLVEVEAMAERMADRTEQLFSNDRVMDFHSPVNRVNWQPTPSDYAAAYGNLSARHGLALSLLGTFHYRHHNVYCPEGADHE